LRIDGQYRRSDDDARMQVSDSKIMFSSPQK